MKATSFWRYFAIGGLVLGQVIPNVFILFALPAIFRQQGIDLVHIGVLSLAMFPFWFKWLWAPIVDRIGNRRIGLRKSWIIPCTTIGALIYALLTLIPPSADTLYLIAGLLLLKNLVMATQDIAVDAYIVESLDRGEEATGAAASAIGTTIGIVVGGSLLVGLYDTLGWQVVMLFAATMLMAGSLTAMLLPERAPRLDLPPRAPTMSLAFREILVHLRSPASLRVLAVVLVVQFVVVFPFRIENAFLVDKGLTLTEIGFLGGGASAIGSIIGNIAGEWIGRKFGLQRAIWLSVIPVVLIGLLYIYVAATPVTGLEYAVVSLAATILGCPLGVAINAVRYRWCSPARTATDYTLQSSLTYLAQAGASIGAAFLANWIGWTAFYVVAGGLLVVTVVALAMIFKPVSAAVARRDAGCVAQGPMDERLAETVYMPDPTMKAVPHA